MPTLRPVPEDGASQPVRDLYAEIKAGFGAGSVPAVYQVLANNPALLEAAVDNRRRIMNAGELDPTLKEWLAWATVTLANNQFGIKVHTARLKRMGITSAQIIEGLSVLQYFSGISAVINGLAMDDDVDPAVVDFLAGSE
ncbi:MAG TPA: carboxymuconolactone decarboxylase family protein [Thermomicrobiaceae bacterium]|nr:carboxymuconolactone decarboxylase family protein [Thermomicrobiaceae bacterium]